ncbi:gliding motility-associated ABC transporter substrate-binding protein GldG [Sphingobacterium oryzagri]|uniref:Gliding motility-associated ABC transporter substrate-binding protein GldG n=1 Tax=Sphingobacterium oryzagri TaxID=3025669 RepID=A0ABY7WR62_9SPHI|nr:gliding motility-associated ABC transporter substrate-binding protein GldG [Sphingobacterium sp. KACC 22765]WDF69794.1 gliding motility-associated ABC transporter substrate-binding protein GldG [Sphingobacterium sp. KACC 22765]
MINIYKKEIRSFFNSLVGYLAIALFLLVTGLLLWVFPETSILENGYASLEGFFAIAPYLFIFLIPAIAMRAIAGEISDGTFELLRSRPHSLSAIVFGKFFGVFTIALLAILPTILYAVSLYFIASPEGNIDIGAIIGSYVGLLFLAAVYSAISLFCSCLTKNSVVAFLLGIFAVFFAYYGFDALGNLRIFSAHEDFVKALGIQTHYLSISRGVLLAEDSLYFVSIILLFLIFTKGHLERGFRKRAIAFTRYGIAICGYFLLNNSSTASLLGRIDFTEDQRFTLSENTKKLLTNLQEPVYLTVFLTGDLPNGFNQLKKATVDMANDFKSYSNGNLKFTLIDPLEGSPEEQQAFTEALVSRGAYPTNLSVKTEQGFTQKLIFPVAIIHSEKQEFVVNLLQQKKGSRPEEALNNSIQNLEYALSSALKKVNDNSSSFIGFSEGHGEPSDLELYDAMQSLAVGNQVGRVNLDSVTYASLDQLNVLFIVKPKTAFSDADKYKLDYFVRHGGRVVWAIDQIDADLQQLQRQGSQPLIGRTLHLDDQLFLYGVRLNYDLIADLNCGQIPLTVGSMAGQSQIELAPWYLFPILAATSAHPVVKNLDGIRTEFIGSIDTIETAAIQKEILLTSSPFIKTINTPNAISLQMVEEAPDPKTFRAKPATVAVLLQGKFPYVFENRPTPSGITLPVDLSNISKESKMLVMSDGDWLINQISAKDQSPYPLGWDRYTEQQFANKVFLQNVVDYLIDDENLISLRNREVKLRLLDQAVVREKKVFWQLINVLLPILVLTITALLQQLWRKRRYGRKRG